MSCESTPDHWQVARDLLIGFSLVSFLYIDVWRLLFLAPTTSGFFLAYGPSDYIAAIATLIAGGVSVAALARWSRRLPTAGKYLVSLMLIASGILVLGEIARASEAMARPWNALRHATGVPVQVLVAVATAGLLVRYAVTVANWYRRLLLVSSLWALVVLARGAWILATLDFDTFHTVIRPTHAGLPGANRVVMIVFDEMDGEVAFTRRPPDLTLPNFDALRATSITFDSAYSPGPNTMESMSSYMLDKVVDSIAPLDANSFLAVLRNGARIESDSASSIFSPLANQGARTALVGFALPYCRLGLTKMIDRCEQIPIQGTENRDTRNRGVLQAVREQVVAIFPFTSRRAHIKRLREVIQTSIALAADSSFTFVFLHLPLPHSPWIWDRGANEFRVTIFRDDGYLGNLALADRVLGQIREKMVNRGTWDRTAVIVTADHPWREKLNQGRSQDRRIPLMVKLPSMTTTFHVSPAWNSIVASSLVPLLTKRSVKDLDSFLGYLAEQSVCDSGRAQKALTRGKLPCGA